MAVVRFENALVQVLANATLICLVAQDAEAGEAALCIVAVGALSLRVQ